MYFPAEAKYSSFDSYKLRYLINTVYMPIALTICFGSIRLGLWTILPVLTEPRDRSNDLSTGQWRLGKVLRVKELT